MLKLKLALIKSSVPPGEDVDAKWPEILTKLPYYKVIIWMFIINLSVIVSIIALRFLLPPEIPLYYGLPEGEQQLAKPILLIIPSSVSLAIIFINILLANLTKDDFIKKTLVTTIVPVTFFSLVTSFKIFTLVGGI